MFWTAAGQAGASLRTGARADFVVLDGRNPLMAETRGDALLGRWIFALGAEAVRDAVVGGRFVIRNFWHEADEAVEAAFTLTLSRLR